MLYDTLPIPILYLLFLYASYSLAPPLHYNYKAV